MNYGASRKLIGEKLRIERLRKEGLLAEQSSTNLPTLIAISEVPSSTGKSSVKMPSYSVTPTPSPPFTRGQKRASDGTHNDKIESIDASQTNKRNHVEHVGISAPAMNNMMSPPSNLPSGHFGLPALWLDQTFMKSEVTEDWVKDLSNSIADVIPVRDIHPWSPTLVQVGLGHGLLRRVLQGDMVEDITSSSFEDFRNLLAEASGLLGVAVSEIGSRIVTAHRIQKRAEEQATLTLSSSKDATLETIQRGTNVAKAFDAERAKLQSLLKNKDDELKSKDAELKCLRSAHEEELKSLKQDNENKSKML